jgi:4-methyl-5(b-hydroxyethyl)-thiazole monophosphate biosynthesis
VKVLQQPLVETGKIITSWNPSTAMPVAYRLLEMLTSKQNADKVRILMGFQ